jgi:transcriptional antiterminator NusG
MTDSGTFEGTTEESAEESGGILAERLAGVAALLSGDAPPEDESTVDEETAEEGIADESEAEAAVEPAIEEVADADADASDDEDAAADTDGEGETAETTATEAVEDEAAEEGSSEEEEDDEAEEILPPASPYDLPGSWYVVHSYSGYENKVKANLGTRIKSMHMEDSIFDIVIPMEDVVEIKSGRKVTVPRKQFPGYILVRMYMDDDSWGVVRNTPGVTGFVGSGTKPTPLSRREVERILGVRKDEEKKAPRFKPDWEVGETVRVLDGPFADFNGVIEDINVDQSKVRVLVDIFGRETPVELNFEQIQKF